MTGVLGEEEVRQIMDGSEVDLVNEDEENFLAAVDEELRQSLSRSMEVEERRRIMVERELVNEDEENYSAAADEEVLDGPEVELVDEDEENFLDEDVQRKCRHREEDGFGGMPQQQKRRDKMGGTSGVGEDRSSPLKKKTWKEIKEKKEVCGTDLRVQERKEKNSRKNEDITENRTEN
ncbi:hypothetical protein BSKO_00772 [Bryopsis sp. KO-2023]|nr:hypothetical protein BSKO_00772 [Bryopsis sp. KO-2023]